MPPSRSRSHGGRSGACHTPSTSARVPLSGSVDAALQPQTAQHHRMRMSHTRVTGLQLGPYTADSFEERCSWSLCHPETPFGLLAAVLTVRPSVARTVMCNDRSVGGPREARMSRKRGPSPPGPAQAPESPYFPRPVRGGTRRDARDQPPANAPRRVVWRGWHGLIHAPPSRTPAGGLNGGFGTVMPTQ
jgi:hypothetical protein